MTMPIVHSPISNPISLESRPTASDGSATAAATATARRTQTLSNQSGSARDIRPIQMSGVHEHEVVRLYDDDDDDR